MTESEPEPRGHPGPASPGAGGGPALTGEREEVFLGTDCRIMNPVSVNRVLVSGRHVTRQVANTHAFFCCDVFELSVAL